MDEELKELLEKVVTYAEIRDYINNLTPEQQQQKARVWIGDDESPRDIELKKLNCIEDMDDDTYYFPEHEYSCTAKDYDKDIMTDKDGKILYPTFEDAIAKEEKYMTPKDRVFLHCFDY